MPTEERYWQIGSGQGSETTFESVSNMASPSSAKDIVKT